MPNYRRNRVPGATYFFTVNLQDRSSSLLTTHIDLLRASVRRVHTMHPFTIEAWVVLPDHLHAIWTLPAGDTDFSYRWKAIKAGFSRALPTNEAPPDSRAARGERGVWQRRFWEHTIRDARDLAAHVDYVHFNPVKHGLAGHPGDWPFSSFHRAVKRGLYPADWGGSGDAAGVWGERSG